MRLGILTITALLVIVSLYPHLPILAQPSAKGIYVQDFWQSQVAINPRLPIQLILLNQTGIPLIYEPTIGDSVKKQSQLRPRGTVSVDIKVINQTGDIASVLIHSFAELDALHYDLATRDNTILVRIRLAGAQRVDKSVYIDERGRVYTF